MFCSTTIKNRDVLLIICGILWFTYNPHLEKGTQSQSKFSKVTYRKLQDLLTMFNILSIW